VRLRRGTAPSSNRSPAIVYLEDVETHATLYDSPQIEAMFGYPTSTYQKDPHYWEKILHPEDRERVMAAEAQATEQGQFSLEYRVMTHDGRAVWVRDEAKVLRDKEGHPVFWQGVIFDISRLKEAEERLRQAETKYRTLVERMPAVTYMQEIGSPDASTVWPTGAPGERCWRSAFPGRCWDTRIPARSGCGITRTRRTASRPCEARSCESTRRCAPKARHARRR